MNKSIVFLIIILTNLLVISVIAITIKVNSGKEILQQNNEYEIYLKSEIYGTDVITLINKATSKNEENNVSKDDKGLYISNNKDSILIDIIMITNEEKKETTTYKMEAINKVGITEFIKNFNTAKFICTEKKYHKDTGNIAYIQLTQQYE